VRRTALILTITMLAFAAVGYAQDEKTKAAEAAAESWLKLVDAGNYVQSWEETSASFKASITKKDWEQRLKGVRDPLGAVNSRKVKAAKHMTHLPGAPDGEYVVIQYDASFANKKDSVETVTPMLEKDGQWRVTGYYIR
jgi:Protein of unknown function (DUF4019)